MRIKLDEETWGERLHRAYRRCKARTGLIYIDQSAAISEFVPVSDQWLIRAEARDDAPTRPKDRQLAYLMLLAYGIEPEDFGLTAATSNMSSWNLTSVKKKLDPERRKKANTERTDAGNSRKTRAKSTTSSRCIGGPSAKVSGRVSAGQRGSRAA